MRHRWSTSFPSLIAGLMLWMGAFGVNAQRIPEPIDEKQVDEYARLLDLTDDQRAIAKSILAQYLDRYYAELLQPIRDVHAREYAAIRENEDRAEKNGENPGTLAKELYPPIMTDMARLAAEVLEFEQSVFFADLASILTDQQSPRMEHVRLRRDLTIASRGIHQFQFPEGDVNLAAQLESLELPEQMRAMLQTEFLPLYEARLLELLRVTAEVNRRWSIGRWDAEAIQWEMQKRPQDVNDPVLQEQLKEYFRIMSSIGEPLVVARLQVVEHNRAALTQLRELLPADAFIELQDRIRRISYPKIWPDAGSAEELFDTVLAQEDLPEDLRAGINDLHLAWAHRYEMLSLDMAEQTMQQRIRGLRRSKEAQREGTRARNELEALGHQRESLNRYQQELLEKMLPPEMLAELPLRDWEANPPPRPWDPSDVLRRKRAEVIAERKAYEERLKQVEEEFERRKREQEQGGGGDGD